MFIQIFLHNILTTKYSSVIIGTIPPFPDAVGGRVPFNFYIRIAHRSENPTNFEKVGVYKMYQVMKRDGALVEFDIAKISAAITKAFDAQGKQYHPSVIDLLALEGDKSDNIPGCPGVGEKTAVKLINEFGSVENLIENAHQIKGALQQKIADNVEQIRFSKFLVTIKTDVPVDVEIDSLVRRDEDAEKLMKLYSELEFKVFMNRLAGKLGKTAHEPETEMGSDAEKLGLCVAPPA